MAEQLVNVHDLVGRCPFATSQKLLAGKWSLLIMHELSEGPVRFRELERRLYPITQATLTRALRQMEDDGLVHREVYGTIPPKVEYSLTEVGAGFKTVLASLEKWGNQYIDYMKAAPVLDREALRVVKMMPRWKPGLQNGKPCRTMFAIPVNFQL